jgi:hypothetical protein
MELGDNGLLKNTVLYARQWTELEICGDPTAVKYFGTPKKPGSKADSTGRPPWTITSFEKRSSRTPDGNIMLAVIATLGEWTLVHLGDAALELKSEKCSPVTEMVLMGTEATESATMNDMFIVTPVSPV